MKKYLVLVAIIGLGVATLCSCSDGKNYQEACRAGDFETALKIVDKLEQKSMELDKFKQYIPENVERYTAARDYVFNAEIQVLMSDGSEEASDRIIFLLNSLPQKGKKLPEGYEGKDAGTSICDKYLFSKDFAWYCETIYSYNEKCRQIMELCINQKNKYLADKIVKLVKKRPMSEGNDWSHYYVVKYTDEDIDEVKKMYDDAVESAVFDE